MTQNEFANLCASHTIEPSVAMENDNVVQLLVDIKHSNCDNARSGYRNCLVQVLENEF